MLIFHAGNYSNVTQIGPDFLEQMKSHLNDPAEECGFVPCDYRQIDYAHMSPEQIQYYIYWRDQLRRGEYPKSDKGYIFLRMCELVNFREDEKSAISQIDFMAGDKNSPFSWENIAVIRFDLAVTQGIKMGNRLPHETVRGAACMGL